jgi:hypothetical protein
MYCWHCGAEIVSASGVCPNCGQAHQQINSDPGEQNSTLYSQPQFKTAARYTGTPPPQAATPIRSAGRSSIPSGILMWIGAIILIRIFASAPSCIHGISENVTKDIVLSDIQYSVMYADASYTTFTWSVSVRNTGSESHTICLECSFCDSLGNTIDTDEVKDIEIQSGKTLKIHDNDSIPTIPARRINKARVRAY